MIRLQIAQICNRKQVVAAHWSNGQRAGNGRQRPALSYHHEQQGNTAGDFRLLGAGVAPLLIKSTYDVLVLMTRFAGWIGHTGGKQISLPHAEKHLADGSRSPCSANRARCIALSPKSERVTFERRIGD